MNTPIFVILNLFQDNAIPLPVIPKQVRDDERLERATEGWRG
jgi:hypothetical protein